MKPIGIIRTPFTELTGMPIQPGGARGIRGELLIKPEFADGLADLTGFSHLHLIYLFHQTRRTELRVVPFMDDRERGVFATRSPLRPNHIGLSIVELIAVDSCRVEISNVDMLDQTPLYDLKPYIAAFDQVAQARSGWMDKRSSEVAAKRSDERFL